MAGYTALEVFGDIDEIARSHGSLDDRRARAKARIDRFRGDLSKAKNLQPGVVDEIVDHLKAKIEGVTVGRSVGSLIDPVFRAALERLTGKPG
jgi:hypothetical protein